MGIQIGAKPDSGFDDPIGMLKDCHRRIEHFLGILCVVVDRAQNRSLTEDEIAAAQAAIQYFRTGGFCFFVVVVVFFFLCLVVVGGCVVLDALEDDHDEAGRLHAEVEALYRSWISNASLAEVDTRLLLSATARLHDLYQAHIAIEDNTVFPKAARMLDKSAVEAIGQEFRARRT